MPVLRVVPALDCLWRGLGAAGLSWREADHTSILEHDYAWASPDDESLCVQSGFYRMMAKLECFLCASDQVDTSEVLDYLPQPDSCKWVRDHANHALSSTEPLGVLISHKRVFLSTSAKGPSKFSTENLSLDRQSLSLSLSPSLSLSLSPSLRVTIGGP